MVRDIVQAYKTSRRVNLKILISGVIILLALVGGMLLKVFIETPDFMFAIKDQMIDDKQ